MSDPTIAGISPSDDGTIAGLIDARRLSALQLLVVGLVTTIMVFDGLSLQILGYATPSILADWNVTKLQLSPAVGITAIGMAIGTLAGGKLGDRWGRKPVLVGTVFLFGLADVGCAAADNVQTLTVMRFISGLGFGACFPNAAALVAEWMPRRAISQAVGIMTVGIPVGGMVGAVVAVLVLKRWGWEGSFIVGGLLSLGLAVAIALWMPESPGWLSRQGGSAELDALLARAWPEEKPTWRPAQSDATSPAPAETTNILTRAHARTNMAVWLGFFINTFVATALLAWGTTALTSMGVQLAVAISLAVPYNIASLICTIGASVVAARHGTRAVMMGLAAATAVVLASSAVLGAGGAPWLIGMATLYVVAGGLIGGIQALLFVLAANSYPLECRSTGVGASSAVGRIGGIASSFGGGAILSLASPSAFFAILSGSIFLIITSAMLADRHVPAIVRSHRR